MMINKLILGTAQFGLDYGINNYHGRPPREDVFKILDYAHANGINTLDTADAYGTALELISAYHGLSKNRFQVISKFKYSAGVDIEELLNKTIKDLKIGQLYCYMFHAFEDILNYPDLVEKICTIKDIGLIKYAGVSVYTNDQLEHVLERKEFDLIQLPYNLLDNDLQRGRYIQKAHQLNKIIHVRSVFLQGLFFKDLSSIHPGDILHPLKESLETLHQTARNGGISITALALQYALRNNNIDGVLVGIETINQLKNNLKELEVRVQENIFRKVDEIEVNNKDLLLPINWK